MKKLILMLAFAGILSGSYAQTLMVSEVPAVVTKAFHRTHAKIDAAEWSKVGDNYKASFVADKKAMAVTYAATGKLKQTEMVISTAGLPTPVLKYINVNYPKDVVKRAAKVTSVTGKVVYAVKIQDLDLNFDSNGKLMK